MLYKLKQPSSYIHKQKEADEEESDENVPESGTGRVLNFKLGHSRFFDKRTSKYSIKSPTTSKKVFC